MTLLPVSVNDQLPAFHVSNGEYKRSWSVFAYDAGEHPGWVSAVYCDSRGDLHWEYAADGVSGYEYDIERLEHITHWIPDLPKPEEWILP